MPLVSGGAYQDAREVTIVWNDARNIGACLKSEAGRTKRVPKRPFLPYLFPRKGKDMAAGGNKQSQICGDLSVSLRLTAPLPGELKTARAVWPARYMGLAYFCS